MTDCDLGDDHVSWLLVAAHNELCQRRADRAATLLELLDVIDPANVQCRKMLAYAYWLRGDVSRAGIVAAGLLSEPLGAGDRAAMEWLRRSPAQGEDG